MLFNIYAKFRTVSSQMFHFYKLIFFNVVYLQQCVDFKFHLNFTFLE
jgi:hypothetical protein